ncbi:MAG: hypothetical protein IIV78_01750, partial [Oscillospiraceae bacterium]|nr:hypothetical protein [Oscillospiraceae bacterium]
CAANDGGIGVGATSSAVRRSAQPAPHKNRGADVLREKNPSLPRRKSGKRIRRLTANRKPQCTEQKKHITLLLAFAKISGEQKLKQRESFSLRRAQELFGYFLFLYRK